MKRVAFVIILLFINISSAIGLNINDSINIAYYDSICPGFKYRYNAIKTCKYSDDYSMKEVILKLNNILRQIENQESVFDEINYFEAIRLLCSKYIVIGDISHIDSTIYAAKKFLFENVENPFELVDLYKMNRVASWIEMIENRYESAKKILEQIKPIESDRLEYLSILQDLALCYLHTQEDDNFSVTAKEAILISDSLPVANYTMGFKIASEKLKAYLQIISENEIEKATDILEEVALKLKDDDKWMRYRYSILNDLCEIYLIDNQIQKYIQTKEEILSSELLSFEERASILESLFGVEWLFASEEDIIKHVVMHSNIMKNIALNNLMMFTPTKNIWMWPNIMEKISKDSFIIHRFPNDRMACEMCYDNLLFLKNKHILSDYAIRQYISCCGSSKQKEMLLELDSLRDYIVYRAGSEEFGESYSYDLSFRESELQKELPILQLYHGKIQNWKDVRSALKDDEIAIEITDCPILNPQDSIYSQLFAFVINKNSSFPQCIKLGNYYDIADEWRMLNSDDVSKINTVYSTPNNSIYRLLWGNLSRYLRGIKTIYISSNTLLSFVNLGALLAPDGCLVSEKWNVRMLSSTSELISNNENEIEYTTATLFGGGNFNGETIGDNSLLADIVRSINSRGNFLEIKGAIEEVDIISNYLEHQGIKVKKYSGTDASESNFRSLNGVATQIIHLATHCFFIADIEKSKYLSRLMAIDARKPAMLATGLILSNANTSWNGLSNLDPQKDGIIISEDIFRFDLSGCDLLVLSGCQSGKGRMNIDGIDGLQQAFKSAGVKTMLLSLWNVDDKVTKDYMVQFYKSLMQSNNKYYAHYSAQKKIREKYKDPFYWAAFIMID